MRTVFHELYRLNNTDQSSMDRSKAADNTNRAQDFADNVVDEIETNEKNE